MSEWLTKTTSILTAASLLVTLLTVVVVHYANDFYFHKDMKRRVKRIEKKLGIEDNGD